MKISKILSLSLLISISVIYAEEMPKAEETEKTTDAQLKAIVQLKLLEARATIARIDAEVEVSKNIVKLIELLKVLDPRGRGIQGSYLIELYPYIRIRLSHHGEFIHINTSIYGLSDHKINFYAADKSLREQLQTKLERKFGWQEMDTCTRCRYNQLTDPATDFAIECDTLVTEGQYQEFSKS